MGSKQNLDEEFEVHTTLNIKHYEKKIAGINHIRWFLIIEGHMDKDTVDEMELEELYEALAAFHVIEKQKSEAAKKS